MATTTQTRASALASARRLPAGRKRVTERTLSGAEPWHAPHPWLATQSAIEKQRAVAQFIATGEGLDSPPDEADLFAAFHACAYQFHRSEPGSAARESWLGKWKSIREHIIQANVGLVYSMIGRFNSIQVDSDDLCSEAMYGLYRAVERYNPWKGYRFSTYACNCIARACMRQRKREQRRHEISPVLFDTPWNLTTEEPDEAVGLRLERLKHAMENNVARLNSLERRILEERFPSADAPARTYKEIAHLVGLSKERVRQIQNLALDKLRNVLAEDEFLQ